MSVLLIGCGDVSVGRLAIERGAVKVLGIDRDPAVIDAAKISAPDLAFECRSAWDLPGGKFDLILLLSPHPEESSQREYFDYLYNFLTDKGLLILTCSAVEDWHSAKWRLAQRGDEIARFPTTKLLFTVILAKYSARDVGYSSERPGSPVKTVFVHARRKSATLLVISGKSWAGKSSLARAFGNYGLPIVHVDNTLGEAYSNHANLKHAFIDFVQANMKEIDVSLLTARMNAAGNFRDFAQYLLMHVSSDFDVTVVEGYPFTYDGIFDAFKREAEAQGFRVAKIAL